MRIAYIVGSFPIRSETFIVNQIAGMAARGNQVDIYTVWPDTPDSMPAAIHRYRLLERTYPLFPSRNPFRRLFQILSLLVLCGWRVPGVVLRSLNFLRYGRQAAFLWLLHAALTAVRYGARSYDIIHAQFGEFGLLALRLVETGALSGEIVTSFRGHDATQYLRENPRLYDVLFRKGRLFLPVSRSLAMHLVEAGCDPAKIRVHHSGIDCTKFRYVEPRRQPGQPTKIISLGRFVEEKGFAYGIQAVASLIASGRAVSYCIVGDGPLRDDLKHLIRELGVEEYVQIAAWKSPEEIVRLVEEAHILIAPSVTATDGTEEGIPNVLKEAMATGRPVVGTFHAGIPELIEDGVCGFLVPERDAQALAERLSYLIDHPEIWPKMGQAGRRRVEEAFDTDRLNNELAALYEGLVERGDDGEQIMRSDSPPGTAEQVWRTGSVRR